METTVKRMPYTQKWVNVIIDTKNSEIIWFFTLQGTLISRPKQNY
jgi:hypothetical protein